MGTIEIPCAKNYFSVNGYKITCKNILFNKYLLLFKILYVAIRKSKIYLCEFNKYNNNNKFNNFSFVLETLFVFYSTNVLRYYINYNMYL